MKKFIYRIPTYGELICYEVLSVDENQAVLKGPTGRVLVIASAEFGDFSLSVTDALKRAIQNNLNFLNSAEKRVIELRKKLAILKHMQDTFQIKTNKKAKA